MNIAGWIDWWAERTPDRAAVRFRGEATSYREFAEDIVRTASVLQQLGVREKHRVAWLGYNSPEFLSTFFACARIGAVIVPLNTRLAPREHLFMIGNAGADILFFDSRFATTAECVAGERTGCRPVVSNDAVNGSSFESLPDLKRKSDGVIDGDPAGSEAPVLIVYTSGTTGRPKGAVLTHNSIHWNGLNSQLMHDLHRDDHVLAALPFFHVGGLNIQTMPALQAGATVTLIEQFHAGRFLEMVETDRPTLTVLVPTQMQAISGHRRWRDADLSSLRCVTTGSTMVPVPLLRIWHDHGIPVIQIYGCTESGPIAIHQVIESAHKTSGSVGRPAMYCDIRLVDDVGNAVRDGEAGEVLIRGPNILKEYWRDPEATAAALQGGWFRTGDIALRDENGHFYIVDRKKRMLISGGENIYPAELERILLEHPAVAEAAVVGVPDDRWGEVPVAAFVCDEKDAPGVDELAGLFEGRLGQMKHPQHFVRFDELPRNAMGKVRHSDLQAEVAGRLADSQSSS
jgi:fatty-acyl-CoA synthase